MSHILFIWAALFFTFATTAQQTFEISSEDRNTQVTVSVGEVISFEASKYGKKVIEGVEIGLGLSNKYLGKNAKVILDKINEKRDDIEPVVPLKNKILQNSYRELVLTFKKRFSLHFRVYNEGIAYRFSTALKGDIEVVSEKMEVTFPEGSLAYFPLEESMYSHYERDYLKKEVKDIADGQFASLPVLFKDNADISVLFSEADLYDYPNLFLQGTASSKLRAIFPKAVLETKPMDSLPDRSEIITKEADYIAKTKGKRTFPWRVFAITDEDKDLLNNELVFKLSSPLEIDDVSWIKPGKVAWDWYNANNIHRVDFESGLNTETYKYYIDFASKYNLEYVILDEGWTKTTTDILHFNEHIDVKELIAYGKQKNVGIILWCLWKPLDAALENILKTYAEWGAKGIKVDFMQRGDQYMVNSLTQIAQEAAKNQLLVDFHGSYKPAGLRRAYPNVISYEGVKGSENNKWSADITPEHNVTLPFIRNVVGPMDYTPGALSNAQKENFNISFYRPMSLGTRAHQVAMYVVYESGLQMLCDTPSSYLDDEHTVEFISRIPVTWDETLPLFGEVGEAVMVAKRKGNNWYVGAMTNWKERSLLLDLSFLPKNKTYTLSLYRDGINSNTYAEDYTVEKMEVTSMSRIPIEMSKGGGWTGILNFNP
ncbi:glycoside hydrolase family 97 protein [Maribacter sp. 2307ULW6-5]|uniref:glycoside hydrolase family 97 protein n=1 Tax=Maribacter sp. 2307ULW6-5 TaxID=3386275 RepID=UPI0039BCAB90